MTVTKTSGVTPPVIQNNSAISAGTNTPAGLGVLDVKAKGVSAADKLAVDSKPPKLEVGPTVTAANTFLDIAESFPLNDLSLIDGKGQLGSKFMLDGSCLAGLQVWVRRVNDDGVRGFEFHMRLTPEVAESVIKRMDDAKATKGPVQFRDTKVGEDGVTTYGELKNNITKGNSHAPADTAATDSQWCRTVLGPKESKVELVDFNAAQALRGVFRIHLRGTDNACTKQLQGFVKQLGLEGLLSPPTAKTKERLMLMRSLWQADNAAAQELSKGGLENVKNEDVRQRLKAAGFTDERLAGLYWEEVYPGHFTGIDPVQKQEMVAAGARYLYSTVAQKEHVLAILQGGQKASLRRFIEGLIVIGMSTNADFSSGGAAGVFTRMVTQDAILNGSSWTGRTYKMLLDADLLARTDWYGWNGDFFGRSWDLKSDTNFGAALVKKIDENGSYRTNNELIFRTGNDPKHIAHVVATTQVARQDLIKHLQENNFEPQSGKSLEEFVMLAPTFPQLGPVPYDTSDPDAFVASAMQKAEQGQTTELRWFLAYGDSGEARAKLEEMLLRSDKVQLKRFALESIAKVGTFAMSRDAVENLLSEWEQANKKSDLSALAMPCFEALLRLDSDAIAARLAPFFETKAISLPNSYSNLATAWLRVLETLAKNNNPEAPSASMRLVLEYALWKLVEQPDVQLLLSKWPIFPTSLAFFESQLEQAAQSPKADVAMRAAALQVSDLADVAPFARKLIAHNSDVAAQALRLLYAKFKGLGLPIAELSTLVQALNSNSPVRLVIIQAGVQEMLESGEPALLPFLEAAGSSLGSFDKNAVLNKLLDRTHLDPAFLRFVVKQIGILNIAADATPAGLAQLEKIRFKQLVTISPDVAGFIQEARTLCQDRTTRSEGNLRLHWLMLAPSSFAEDLPATLRLVGSHAPLAHTYNHETNLGAVALARLKLANGQVDSNELAKVFLEFNAHTESIPKDNADWLTKFMGPSLLLADSPEALAAFQQLDLNRPPFNKPEGVLAALRKHRTSDSEAARSFAAWLLKEKAPEWIERDSQRFAELAEELGITPQEVGYASDEERLAMIGRVFKSQFYNIQSAKQWPPSLGWLMQDKGKPNTAVFDAVLAQIPSWGSQYASLAFDCLQTFAPKAWKVRVLQAQKAYQEKK